MSSDFSELAAAESYIDQQYAIDSFRDKLNIDYDEDITRGVYFLVDGVEVPSEDSESDLEHSVFYGRIDAFSTHQDIAGRYWLSALIINDLTKERNQVFVSCREGYESSFMAVVNERTRLDTSEWDEIAKLYGRNNKVGFLGRVVAKFAFDRITLDTEERLQALEQVLDTTYGIAIDDHVDVVGRHAHHGTGRPVSVSAFASEGSYNGIYRGISLLGVEPTSRNRSQENWPCLAIELLDGTIVQQPLHALNQLERATV